MAYPQVAPSTTYAAQVTDPASISPSLDEMLVAARSMDEGALRDALVAHAEELGVEAAVTDVVLPFLNAVGVAWERGHHSVATEHFASQVVRSWLSGAALEGSPEPLRDRSPIVLVCPPGERHDLGLLCFHVLLVRNGIPARFLGSDTPLPGLADVCRLVDASGVVVAAPRRRVFEAHGGALRVLARSYPVALGGAGADAEVAELVHATALPADMRLSLEQAIAWYAGLTAA
jgi:hypothetical protein